MFYTIFSEEKFDKKKNWHTFQNILTEINLFVIQNGLKLFDGSK